MKAPPIHVGNLGGWGLDAHSPTQEEEARLGGL